MIRGHGKEARIDSITTKNFASMLRNEDDRLDANRVVKDAATLEQREQAQREQAEETARYIKEIEDAERRERERVRLAGITHATKRAIKSKRKIGGKKFLTVEQLFTRMDKNGDGSIDKEEFKQAMKRLDIFLSDRQITTLMGGLGDDENKRAFFKNFFADLESDEPIPLDPSRGLSYSHSGVQRNRAAGPPGAQARRARGIDYDYLTSLHGVHQEKEKHLELRRIQMAAERRRKEDDACQKYQLPQRAKPKARPMSDSREVAPLDKRLLKTERTRPKVIVALRVLQLTQEDSLDGGRLKKAYHRACLRMHPDKQSSKPAFDSSASGSHEEAHSSRDPTETTDADAMQMVYDAYALLMKQKNFRPQGHKMPHSP